MDLISQRVLNSHVGLEQQSNLHDFNDKQDFDHKERESVRGVREMVGFFVPPVSANYTFYASGWRSVDVALSLNGNTEAGDFISVASRHECAASAHDYDRMV